MRDGLYEACCVFIEKSYVFDGEEFGSFLFGPAGSREFAGAHGKEEGTDDELPDGFVLFRVVVCCDCFPHDQG